MRPHALRLLCLTVLGLLSLGALAPSAQAETAFRYWGYATADGDGWVAAAVGAAEVDPSEGSVQGMRFAVHGTEPELPRVAADFDVVCAGTEPVADGERVAVVIDPGTEQDAVDGEVPGPVTGTCVLAGPEDTAQDVLAAAAELRTDDSGLICALDGYPATGCGDPAAPTTPSEDGTVEMQLQPPVGFPAGSLTSTAPSPAAEPDPASPDAPGPGTGVLTAVVAAVAVVVIGGGLAVTTARRRRQR